MFYIVVYTELSKILRLYDPHKHQVFPSRNVIFLDSTKCFESIESKSPADLPFDLDNYAHWTIEENPDLWEWIVQNLVDAFDRAENGNPTLYKFIRIRPDEDNLNLGISDKVQERLDKLIIPDFLEKEKSKSPTLPPNPGESSTNYKKSTVDISHVNIDHSQYQEFSERPQPCPSITSNKPNMRSHTMNFDKFDF
jgi:hypothetical protein